MHPFLPFGRDVPLTHDAGPSSAYPENGAMSALCSWSASRRDAVGVPVQNIPTYAILLGKQRKTIHLPAKGPKD